MLLDFCKMTSTTGGTGALTCTAQTGFPDVAEAVTGTVFINYSVAEYTSSAKTQLSKAETGIGSFVTSTGVLTRTKVLSTWDGTDYRPLYGNATAPTAISFGTTSANIDILVGPYAAGFIPPIPFVMGSVTSVSDGLGTTGLNFTTSTGNHTLATGVTYFIPYLIGSLGPFSKASVRCTTAATAGGGTASTLTCAIYEIGGDGKAGRRLINFGNLGRITSTGTYSNTSLATPVFLVPGWYWVELLWVANSDSGSPILKGAAAHSAGPMGVLMAAAQPSSYLTLGSQTSLPDPSNAATGQGAAGVWPLVSVL